MAQGIGAKSNDIQNEVPLTQLKTGDEGVVFRLNGNEEFRSKMLALGVVPGKRINITRGGPNQPYILKVDESRLVIDWTSLSGIVVQPKSGLKRRGGWRW